MYWLWIGTLINKIVDLIRMFGNALHKTVDTCKCDFILLILLNKDRVWLVPRISQSVNLEYRLYHSCVHGNHHSSNVYHREYMKFIRLCRNNESISIFWRILIWIDCWFRFLFHSSPLSFALSVFFVDTNIIKMSFAADAENSFKRKKGR